MHLFASRPFPRLWFRGWMVVLTGLLALCAAGGSLQAAEKKRAAAKPVSAKALTARAEPTASVYSLADCLTLAARQNPDVLVAGKRVEGAKGTLTEAKAGLFPTLASNGYYQRREQAYASSGGLDVNRNPNDYALTNRLTQSLYSAGAVRNRVAIGKIGLQTASLDYQTALDTAGLAVRLAFYQTLYAEKNIGVRQEAVDLLGAQLKDQRDRLAAGSVSQLNVNRAQVTLANEQPALDQARYELRAAYIQLAQLLGVAYPDNAVNAPFRIRGELVYRDEKLPLEECLRRAEASRPEIQSRKLALEILARQVNVEKSGARPRVDAFAGYDLYSETSTLAARDFFSGYIIGLQGSWQIFDGLATLGRVRTARARVGGGAAELDAEIKQVQGEVRSAYYQLQQAEATLRPQAENIHLANDTLNVTRTNFDVGLANQLDILQARVDLTRAQSNELAARLACNQAKARLDRAMGEGRPDAGSAAKDNLPAAK